jgi:integrase
LPCGTKEVFDLLTAHVLNCAQGRKPSAAGRRTVPYFGPVQQLLNEARIACVWHAEPDGLFFGRSSRIAFGTSIVRNRANAAWKAAKLRPVTLHECRHTFASLLASSGLDLKACATYMGHANVQMFIGRYAHLFEDSRGRDQQRVNDYLATA